MSLRTVTVMRYIVPLREGGSLPALVEADDGFKYVLKFRGAGHGVKMLISELMSGQIASRLGLQLPELVFAYLDDDFGKSEGDEEIQDLLKASEGLNLGMHFLSGALPYEPSVKIDPLLASKIVWFDAFTTNVDRTVKNPNLLLWHRELWLIDNGDSFYFHHSWKDFEKHALSPFSYSKDHVLLPQATMLDEADAFAHAVLSDDFFGEIVRLIPDDWLHWKGTSASPDEIREVYFAFLKTRFAHSSTFVNAAKNDR
ncbi:HipA family kinase [Anaerorudis cellulosivorans]|uniref:HipA family kinase n=1 Tax=Anaerorudis cellulosivorans TaxID=3397862 RepID=UPI002220F3D6|nr:HipA family kinase [Seramator thermalis]MCW1735977.1 aminotransferase class I and II [Seramator thermalis]